MKFLAALIALCLLVALASATGDAQHKGNMHKRQVGINAGANMRGKRQIGLNAGANVRGKRQVGLGANAGTPVGGLGLGANVG